MKGRGPRGNRVHAERKRQRKLKPSVSSHRRKAPRSSIRGFARLIHRRAATCSSRRALRVPRGVRPHLLQPEDHVQVGGGVRDGIESYSTTRNFQSFTKLGKEFPPSSNSNISEFNEREEMKSRAKCVRGEAAPQYATVLPTCVGPARASPKPRSRPASVLLSPEIHAGELDVAVQTIVVSMATSPSF